MNPASSIFYAFLSKGSARKNWIPGPSKGGQASPG